MVRGQPGRRTGRGDLRHGHLSQVLGLRLRDARQVVVKVRPAAPRLAGCVEVQRVLGIRGFPCPRLLAGPTPLGAYTATAEAFLPGGAILAASPATTRLSARALRRLIVLAPGAEASPTLEPAPPWAGWDHTEDGVWPIPDDRAADLNAHPGPAWLDAVGERVRTRLASSPLPHVVAHVDWEMQNLRWCGERLHAAHDWDSVALRPEAGIVGLAAAVHTATGEPSSEASDDQVEAFLLAYEDARRRPFTREEREVAWAAGLWVRAFNAKKDSLDGDGPSLARLVVEAPRRLERASA